MELSDSKIKKFSKMEPCTFPLKLEKIEKNPSRENFLYSGKMELSNTDITKALIFSQEKAFLQEVTFRAQKTSYISRKWKFLALRLKNSCLF